MIYFYIFLLLGFIALTFFIIFKCQNYSLKVVFAKSVASVLFILTALAAATIANKSNPQYNFTFFVIAGLAFGMLGDVWLDLKLVYKGDDKVHTYFGFVAFMLGHICYMAGLIFCFGNKDNVWYIIGAIAVGLVLGVIFTLLEKVMKLDYGSFKGIVMVYCGILLSMMLLALSLSIYYGFKNLTTNVMFFGGVLFLISDLILSGSYFGIGKDKKIHIITNSLLYYWAQFIIASSILTLG